MCGATCNTLPCLVLSFYSHAEVLSVSLCLVFSNLGSTPKLTSHSPCGFYLVQDVLVSMFLYSRVLQRLRSFSFSFAVSHASRSAVLVSFCCLCLSCPDPYIGHRCTLVCALLMLAAGAQLTDNAIESTINILFACRPVLQIKASVAGSSRFGTAEALHRLVVGLRSTLAKEILEQYDATPFTNSRWVWSRELVRWIESGSTNTARFENYSPG